MLHSINTLNKKGYNMFFIVSMLLALFVGIILITIFGRNYYYSTVQNNECEKNGGLCVEAEKCTSCINTADCRARYDLFPCKENEKNKKIGMPYLICCPKEFTIGGEENV